MKERPILFSAPMVLAILAGKKTQTRRIVKPSPGRQSEWLTESLLNSVPHGVMAKGGWQMHHPRAGTVFQGVKVEEDSPLGWIRSPYGEKGDQLWVREAFTLHNGEPVFRADNSDKRGNMVGDVAHATSPIKWKPSIHMPRAASRIQLEITDIRVERLKDISEADAKAEGVNELDSVAPIGNAVNPPVVIDHRIGFERLWKQINGADSWDKNPWVWVVEFRKI